ncbi:hypothetical protein CCMA1212_010439 [Trichoderma ghanense]|uniref:Uncharacterized protein n=1 Tax=Trichoderma ghanense TaxID=65468 RepID=A0ABY2GQD7_9HYPO
MSAEATRWRPSSANLNSQSSAVDDFNRDTMPCIYSIANHLLHDDHRSERHAERTPRDPAESEFEQPLRISNSSAADTTNSRCASSILLHRQTCLNNFGPIAPKLRFNAMYLSPNSEWPDFACWGGHITADTDIGGPGILTTSHRSSSQKLVGSGGDEYSELCPPGQALRRSYPLSRAVSHRISETAARNKFVSPRVRRALKLLGPLCDLQIITSMGIMVAGFAKWNTINFYHEALVTCNWSLIFNSFCVIRFDLLEPEGRIQKRDALRRIFVLISCMLGVVWQILTYQRELDPAFRGHWDASDPDYCYLFLYESSPWFWIAGTIFFCIAVASSLTRRTAQWFAYLDHIFVWAQDCCNEPLRKARKHQRRHRGLLSAFTLAAASIRSIACSILIQSIAIWGYGDNYPPLSWLCYFLFSVWNTVDVMSLWQLNKGLLSGDESDWGFGQVLPLVMLLSVFFSAVDVWHGKTTRIREPIDTYGSVFSFESNFDIAVFRIHLKRTDTRSSRPGWLPEDG